MYCRHTIKVPLEIVLSDLEQQLGIDAGRACGQARRLASSKNMKNQSTYRSCGRESAKLVQIAL